MTPEERKRERAILKAIGKMLERGLNVLYMPSLPEWFLEKYNKMLIDGSCEMYSIREEFHDALIARALWTHAEDGVPDVDSDENPRDCHLTVITPKGRPFVSKDCYMRDGKWHGRDGYEIYNRRSKLAVIAWMYAPDPPEPYLEIGGEK